MAGENTYLESDGKSVEVDLLYDVEKGQLVVVDGWLGIANASGNSGSPITLSVDGREYQLTVPAALNVAKGDVIFVELADVTGHKPDDSAYSKSAGAGKVAAFKATMDQNTDNVVTAVMLGPGQLAS